MRVNSILLGYYTERSCIADHANEDWIDGEKTEDVVSFLDRLYTAKRKAEERIIVLGGEDSSVRRKFRHVLINPNTRTTGFKS